MHIGRRVYQFPEAGCPKFSDILLSQRREVKTGIRIGPAVDLFRNAPDHMLETERNLAQRVGLKRRVIWNSGGVEVLVGHKRAVMALDAGRFTFEYF